MIRVLLTGGSGTLGRALQECLADGQISGFEVIAPSRAELDLSEPESVARVGLGKLGRFDWVINAAAYTWVDQAETHREECYAVNALGASWLARATQDVGARMIHISTDCVFDGNKQGPYIESDQPHPIQVYGASKLEGEIAVLEACLDAVILRTSWLFGKTGKSFPKVIAEKLLGDEPVQVVDDQIGVPVDVEDLSRVIVTCMNSSIPPGVYHACGTVPYSRFGWAEVVASTLSQLGIGPVQGLKAIKSADRPAEAKRPQNSVLDSTKLLNFLEQNGFGEAPAFQTLPNSTERLLRSLYKK